MSPPTCPNPNNTTAAPQLALTAPDHAEASNASNTAVQPASRAEEQPSDVADLTEHLSETRVSQPRDAHMEDLAAAMKVWVPETTSSPLSDKSKGRE